MLINTFFLCICLQSYGFLISSDYERAEWREMIKEQQKKCKCLGIFGFFSHLRNIPDTWTLHTCTIETANHGWKQREINTWTVFYSLHLLSSLKVLKRPPWRPWSCKCWPAPASNCRPSTTSHLASIKKVGCWWLYFKVALKCFSWFRWTFCIKW